MPRWCEDFAASSLPETMGLERRNLLRALGCKVVLTDSELGLLGTIERAEEIVARLGDRAWMPDQTRNQMNPRAHYLTTGPEIWSDTAGGVDVLVAAIGTGGTITGAGRYLRERKPAIHVVGVEPAESPLLSEGRSGRHSQVGLDGAFVAEVLDTGIYDEIVQTTDQQAFETTRRLAREEAILAGISSGSATWAALQVAAREEYRGKLVIALLPDSGLRYLSNPVYAEVPEPDFSPFDEALQAE
jgi:cysteine synthase A